MFCSFNYASAYGNTVSCDEKQNTTKYLHKKKCLYIIISIAYSHISFSIAYPDISFSIAYSHISFSNADPHISFNVAYSHISFNIAYPHISSLLCVIDEYKIDYVIGGPC